MDDLLQIGIITAPRGLKGELKVFPTTDDKDRFLDLESVLVSTPEGIREMKIESCRFFKQFVLPFSYLFYNSPALFGRKQFDWVKTLSVCAFSKRYDRHTFPERDKSAQVFNAFIKILPVVYTSTQNYLKIHFYMCFIKLFKLLKKPCCIGVFKHIFAKFHIRGMYGNIDGRKMIKDYSVKVFIFHICKSDIIPLQK